MLRYASGQAGSLSSCCRGFDSLTEYQVESVPSGDGDAGIRASGELVECLLEASLLRDSASAGHLILRPSLNEAM